MKIRDLRLDDSISVNAEDIPIDTVFSGTMGITGIVRGRSSIFVRAFDVIVDLRNPRNTWTIHSSEECSNYISVMDYQPLKAQLVVGSKDEYS